MSSSNKPQKRNQKPAHKKESILELTKMIDAKVRVKCIGGRELVGTLRGYDELVNLVLDEAIEFMRGMYNNHYYAHKCRTEIVLSIFLFKCLFCSRN